MIERFCGRDFKHPGHRWISARVQYQCGGLGNKPKEDHPTMTRYWYIMGPTMPAQFGRGYSTAEAAEKALRAMVPGLNILGVDVTDYIVKLGWIYS